MKFRVLAGSHYDGKKLYSTGQVFKSDKEMDRAFPGKFQRLTTIRAGVQVENIKPAEEDMEEVGEKDEEAPETAKKVLPKGENVSKALGVSTRKTGLLVFKVGTAYSVYDQDFPKKALNEKPLRKVEVAAFVKKVLEGE